MTTHGDHWETGLYVSAALLIIGLALRWMYLHPIESGKFISVIVVVATVPYILGRIAHAIL